MSRSKKRSDSEVLLKCFDVIAREGFTSFTFEQVGKSVGLSPATLVKRFKNKKNFAMLARNCKWDSNLNLMENSILINSHGIKGIYNLVDIISRSVDSKKLGEHAIWLGTEACNASSKKKVAAYFKSVRAIFCKYMQEAILNKEISSEIDPIILAKTLEALVQGGIFQFAFLEENFIHLHLKDHLDTFLKPYLLNKKS